MRFIAVSLLCLITLVPILAQDSVDVTFRYTIAGKTGVSLVGEFNGWNNALWPMTNIGSNTYTRTARLRIGGNPSPVIPGAWQYKFYYSGASPWPNDPLDHHINQGDNGNSYIITKDPTIYQLLPNQNNPVVNTSFPTITANIFPKVGSTVDTSSLAVSIDGTLYPGLGTQYNFTTSQFAYTPLTPLANGSHTVILHAGTNADTVTFTTHGGYVQIQNEFPFTTWKNTWLLNGLVQDTSITTAKIVRNTIDTFSVSVSNGLFSSQIPLVEGINNLIAEVDSFGVIKTSSPVTFTRKVNHSPWAVISLQDTSGEVTLTAGQSTDPDSGQTATLTFQWGVDPTNPSAVSGVSGATTTQVTFSKPAVPGEYYFSLIATDSAGNKDTTRNYIIVNSDLTIIAPTTAFNPDWAQKGRIYFLFPKAASSAGTLNAAAQKLQYIKDMGFNVVWLTPIMKNAFPIDNNDGPGYNIVDFYTVAPEYGTDQDFKNFMIQAHAIGLKVILDITPNHSSSFHPWSVDAHTYNTNSPYWNWYEHAEITSNTNGLGDCLDGDGFNYYCGFSTQLLNLNWKDVDLRTEMINMFKYWVQQYGVDGFRFDVYWGPHRRYGEQYMGQPVRAALKHIKPDVLLLGEDDGTGGGTQVIYADNSVAGINGGLDAAYDFSLYHNQIENFGFSHSAIQSLQSGIDNGGYYPGEHSLYMRFMEDQDEDRIVYFYSNQFAINATTTFMRTMPMASVLFTIPGIPTLWNGQEVGMGYGITASTHARDRSVINWGYQGKTLLTPHYQRLANIRAQFPAFTQHKKDTNHDGQVTSADVSDFVGISDTNSIMYAFSRPWTDQNGLTVVNFSGSTQTALLNFLSGGGLKFTGGIQPGTSYYLNNLYTNTSQQILGSDLSALAIQLPPYGTGIYTLSTTRDSVTILNPVSGVLEKSTTTIPREFSLEQNYPNPFNPSTAIRFDVPKRSNVTLKVFDVIGREVATLVSGEHEPGTYSISWNANNLPSGVYFYRLVSESGSAVRKMLFMK